MSLPEASRRVAAPSNVEPSPRDTYTFLPIVAHQAVTRSRQRVIDPGTVHSVRRRRRKTATTLSIGSADSEIPASANEVAVSTGNLAGVCERLKPDPITASRIVADNISANVIGLLLGTAFRFLLYRFWVYGHHRKDGLSAQEHKAEAAALAIFEDDAEASKDADGPVRPITTHD